LLFEREVEEKIGQDGKPNLKRKASRDGHETRHVVLDGPEVRISRLRVRTVEDKEVVPESCKAAQE